MIFIKFDIQEFYPLVTEDILKISLSTAKEYQNKPEQFIWIIKLLLQVLIFLVIMNSGKKEKLKTDST